MQSLSRRSLPLRCLTLSQCTVKSNALPPVKCMASPRPISTRATNKQHHYMQISYTTFNRYRNIYLENADRNSFTPPRKVRLSSRSIFKKIFCGHPETNVIKIRKIMGENFFIYALTKVRISLYRYEWNSQLPSNIL